MLSLNLQGFRDFMPQMAHIAQRRRYQVDLVAQQAMGDMNYLRLCKLLHDLHNRDQWCFSVCLPVGHDWHVSVNVEERARFTTTVLLSRHQGPCRWTQSPTLKVRMYHDARMAEVVACERHRVSQGRYDYPNGKMYQADEKAQLNRFLGEWLALCLAQGKAPVNLKLTG